ncbi:MBL fold metallo-hydrolase [Streptomyces sp. NBC_00536]|uniref:MBL fold metallo-hydrolase n=1 Tax=Streptomyces sp. NBC_00536 TaxID=2975769 RepID=UPI002E8204FE|nr:MBL fold metallo-hydrolase [Streptomyces sp. NBC_00536]WUC78226.1 MBL fold metallo-hydrolase [Streptomyces sp. NBC_00536]
MTAEKPYLVQPAPGVFAYIQPDGGWCLNNAGFVTGGGRSLLVDTAATERRALALRDAITSTGSPLPRTVVNTHHHGDHTYGNAVFTPEALVLGHDRCRSEQLDAGRQLELIWPDTDFGTLPVTAPDLTYSERATVHVGDTEVEVIHPGVAHTVGDSVVWLPGQRTVFTGDLVFAEGTPFLAMGSLAGSLRALELLRALDAETVVPGHGPLTDPSAYDATERYLRYVDQLAREGRERGDTPLETARRADLGEFAGWRESERLVANLHRAYAELAGGALGEPLDIMVVLRDMTVMNGGVPIACHA